MSDRLKGLPRRFLLRLLLAPASFALGGCTLLLAGLISGESIDPGAPSAVAVPQGHKVALETVGVGEVTYVCREKRAGTGQFEWQLVGPQAQLSDRSGRRVGQYAGQPATWQSADGSAVGGTPVATSPAPEGALPLQLLKTDGARGKGAMAEVTYVQRLATRGGVSPVVGCDLRSNGTRQAVDYRADYIFWAKR